MRGPSGRGASRAEEKDASRLARTGVLAKSLPPPLGSRNTAFTVHRPSDISAGASETSITGFHESRNTNHGFYAFHETRITAFLVPLGTEALQSCFFRPGLLGMSTRRHRPCGSRIRAFKAFTSHKSLILRFLRDTSHETRVTAFTFFTNHGFVFFTNHETRNMVSLVPVGTEALQSFFSGPGCVA